MTTYRLYRCKDCGALADQYYRVCPSCWKGIMMPKEVLEHVRKLNGQSTLRKGTSDKYSLADTELPSTRRISTGIESLDRVFGTSLTGQSGIRVPSVVLFGGAAGSGKTTLLLEVCANLSVTSRGALYVSTEQTKPEIRETVERIGLSSRIEQLRVLTYFHHPLVELSDMMNVVRELNPVVVILDSLTKLRNKSGYDAGDGTGIFRDTRNELKNVVKNAKAIANDAAKHNRAYILISHLNKNGEITGLKELDHDVSAVLMMERYGKYRYVWCPEKNRWGEIGIKAWFEMTPHGLVETDPPQNKESCEPSSSS